ncbi:hypothetical protein [Planctomicrobium sp. SH664]|uniref:hypothetical protein n=1 Tax=Planctomicrobium sp. SH664 TaxID=3448125 RepID=UPI003F5CAC73
MASKRLLDKRREHEAAEKQGKVKAPAEKKKSARKATTTRKRKAKAPDRKRLLWGVFSGTLKEEGRFAWDEKDKAEEKLAQLRAKSKKLYFIQPIKEVLSESARPTEDAAIVEDEELLVDEDADLDDLDEEDEDEDEDMDEDEGDEGDD